MTTRTTSVPVLIALDWGTSMLRGYLLGPEGNPREERAKPFGIMRLPKGGYAEALEAIAGDWLAQWPELPVIACGMVGSAQGWREAPYVPCPARAEDLASGLVSFDPRAGLRLHIVPGASKTAGLPDVMRGEETQIFGAIGAEPALRHRARIVHPGTHAKWVEVRDGALTSFQTYMTGELFALLSEHSILGRPAKAEAERRKDATKDSLSWRESFARGVTAIAGHAPKSLAPLLFSARSLVLTGALGALESLDYLSGLLIGDEIRCALAETPAVEELVVMGDPALCARYRYALELLGVRRIRMLEDAAAQGLWQIATAAGLVRTSAAEA